MKLISTRGEAPAVSLSEAIMTGLAPDGGLYLPETLPAIDPDTLDPDWPLWRIAAALFAPFFKGDVLEDALETICREAFSFPVGLDTPDPQAPNLAVLELFHGPTAAFKDFGARFLAQCLRRLKKPGDAPFTILVATSGDTGGAVAAAFDGASEARVAVLYPEGRVSKLQEHQLACWSDTVTTLSVRPDFDTCQALVKQAFNDPAFRSDFHLTSANSINIARLMAQMSYYAWAALVVARQGRAPVNVIVPTGNLGNALAAVWAKRMGLPIGRIICAVNANRTVADYFETARYEPRASVPTQANAMDVGAPSNFERLTHMAGSDDLTAFGIGADWVSDALIESAIGDAYRRTGRVWCPHTAVGLVAHARLSPDDRAAPWVVAATAHASKFPDVVEPIIGRRIDPAPPLAALLDRPKRIRPMEASLGALRAALEDQRALLG